MKLYDVVRSLIETNGIYISNKDIEETIMFLLQDDVLDDSRVIVRIAKHVNEQVEYDKAQCS